VLIGCTTLETSVSTTIWRGDWTSCPPCFSCIGPDPYQGTTLSRALEFLHLEGVIVGAEIIESIKFPFAVGPLVRAHHEKGNGSGYPEGLKGEEIPLAARILTAVDCFDALASDRQYRKALPLDQAMAAVLAESGKSFDPQVVAALGRRYRELEQLAKATLDGANLEFSTEVNVWRGSAPDAGFNPSWPSLWIGSPARPPCSHSTAG
jgi:HD domain